MAIAVIGLDTKVLRGKGSKKQGLVILCLLLTFYQQDNEAESLCG